MQTFTLTYPWDDNGYKPHVEFHLDVEAAGFSLRILVQEENPKRTAKEHQAFVHKDSCVEWFVNFAPDMCDRYFNFEVNANGAMRAAFRKDRYDFSLLSAEDISSLEIETLIAEKTWEVSYHVPFALIRKYIPEYQYQCGMSIRTNFYKCGDETAFPHFGVWNAIPLEKPDFHRPEYFGIVTLNT